MHAKAVLSNKGEDKQVIRYPDQMVEAYVLFLSLGECTFTLLNEILVFPTMRMVQNWKAALKRKFHINSTDVYDEKKKRINTLVQKLWFNDREGEPVNATIAVDACSVTPNVLISKEDALMSDQSEFDKLVAEQENGKSITKYIFTFYLIPWVKNFTPIPIISHHSS